MKVVCQIKKYDVKVQKSPYTFINLEKFECEKPEIDDLGQTFAAILNQECKERGYIFRFYSMSQEKNITYDVTVRGEMEETDLYKKLS